ncbi:hypothetical protein EYC80_009473 [Monilinia laxa]|uniref:Uncharacterized protein n=1 Tax=Monilinia laxa TaxID=61186 RepID=A0A5N6JXY6_MONLA|nr:hypothetical protein EYC80_009473 [Monilinia laxa]
MGLGWDGIRGTKLNRAEMDGYFAHVAESRKTDRQAHGFKGMLGDGRRERGMSTELRFMDRNGILSDLDAKLQLDKMALRRRCIYDKTLTLVTL